MGICRVGCLLIVLGLPLKAAVLADSVVDIMEEPPEMFIGFTLKELYGRFGVPEAVYSVRGADEWQDDVVLVYPQGDFYVYRDRVWQLGIKAVRGIRVGDSREAVILALGEEARKEENYVLLPIYGRPWPITLRINLGASAKVVEIFVYRSDF